MPTKTTCRCAACNGEIEFQTTRSGETITCPWCAQETELYIPGGLARIEPIPAPTEAPPQVTENGEQIFYRSVGAVVTSARVVFGAQTIPVRNITSVQAIETPAKRGWPMIGILAGGLFAIAGITGAKDGKPDQAGAGIFLAIFFGAIACWSLIKFLQSHTTYSVLLNTAGTDRLHYTSRDSNHIRDVFNAINNAIATR